MSLHHVNRLLTFCLVLDLKLRATSKSQRVQHAVPELWYCLGPQRVLENSFSEDLRCMCFGLLALDCMRIENAASFARQAQVAAAASKQIYKQLQIMMPRSMAERNEPTQHSKREFPSVWVQS